MPTQFEKATAFRALHQRSTAFLIPNPWDAGSARLLQYLGFEALASTSAGAAFSAARPDGGMGRDAMLAHLSQLTAATDLPVSADLENGYADSPEAAAETIRLAAATGIVGGSIEDYSGQSLYDLHHAADRVRAAVEAARSLPFPFTLTARAENYLRGRTDIKDTIARLQAFEQAGADVLYAPGIVTKEDIAAVVSSVSRPVNVVLGFPNVPLTVADLNSLGVRRISIGATLARVAYGAFLRAAREMRDPGTFTFANDAAPGRELNAIFSS